VDWNLIIVNDYSKDAIAQAQNLKTFSEEDTDVELIKASDLMHIVNQRKNYSDQKHLEFNWDEFNTASDFYSQLNTN